MYPCSITLASSERSLDVQDSENNTILILLANARPPLSTPHSSGPSEQDFLGATLRMARMYIDRYSDILDWANMEGKTALHVAALKGNEELVRVSLWPKLQLFSFILIRVRCSAIWVQILTSPITRVTPRCTSEHGPHFIPKETKLIFFQRKRLGPYHRRCPPLALRGIPSDRVVHRLSNC